MSSSHLTPIEPSSFGARATFSQGIAAGGLVFVAGQVAIDERGEVIAPADTRAQTAAALDRVEAVLREVGCGLSDVASATVWLTDMKEFPAFNEAWAEKFGAHRPARATLRSDLLLPGLCIEIQAIAVRPQE
jgi:2-iminobutanoate/2-iminopropanoate deaminase